MKLYDLLSMAYKNLARRKLRASLTILGVVIGATSIIIMLSIGIGLNESFEKQFTEMASLNTVSIYPTRGDETSDDPRISQETMDKIMKRSDVTAVMPTMDVSFNMSYEEYSIYGQILAIKPEFMKQFDYKIDKGRLLEPDDEMQVVIGSSYHEQAYDTTNDYQSPEEKLDLLGEELDAKVYVKDKEEVYNLEVVGVLKASDYSKNFGAFVNINYFQEFMNDIKIRSGQKVDDEEGYKKALVYMKDRKNVEQFLEEAKNYNIRAESSLEFINQTKKQMAIIQVCLGGLGGISLLVAAIGITNTMIMSTYERTKEIGVMKVIGSNLKDIKKLFLVEAAFIGLLGGAVGLIISMGLSALLNKVGGAFMGAMMPDARISVIPPWLMLGALVFSTAIGITAGYFPAKRAMNLSALQAIRSS